MTVLESKPLAATPPDDLPAEPRIVWLPADEPRRGRHLGWWLGIPAGLIAVAAGVCAAILVAPGVIAAGVDIGWRTPGAASELVANALANTEITLHTSSKDVTFTGAQLGLSVDALAVTTLAYGTYPLWKVGEWNPGNVAIDVDVDPEVAHAALAAAAPSIFSAPVNAAVKYNSRLDEFTAVEATSGQSIDLARLATAVSDALSSGSRDVQLNANPLRVDAAVSTSDASQQAKSLNTLIDSAGFYVDGAEVAAFDPADAASWLDVTVVEGALVVDVDTDAATADVWKVVASLPRTVNRPAVNEVIVTNSAGDHLRTVQEGVDGWKLGATGTLVADFVASFAAGKGEYELTGTSVAYGTTLSLRTIEVNKATGQTILYENGEVVDTYPIAIGRPATPTPDGHFTVFVQLLEQDMGCVPGYDYCTPHVPWISYFSGDNGFHGTYWHDNFGAGAMMSHGCVNMTIAAAERVYYFAQIGTEVWVHE